MKSKIIVLSISFALIFSAHAQTFNKEGFKFDGDCTLKYALSTSNDNGDKINAYQCISQTSPMINYRVQVITFKDVITDIDEYFRTLKIEYSNLGTATTTTLKGKRAVLVIENINLQGHALKQISVSTLYKNKSITLVLVTNSASYKTLLEEFKNQFSFL